MLDLARLARVLELCGQGLRHPEALVELAQEGCPCEWSQSLFTALDHERTIERRAEQGMVGVTHRRLVLA